MSKPDFLKKIKRGPATPEGLVNSVTLRFPANEYAQLVEFAKEKRYMETRENGLNMRPRGLDRFLVEVIRVSLLGK